MLQFDPEDRLTMEQLVQHPWWNGPIASLEEIQYEFT